ncbi:hypothetical protein Tco_1406148 [Tanacetum coccineum]
MSRVTSKGSALELVKKETDTRVTCTVDALKHSEILCAITMHYMLRMERTFLGNSPTANIKGKGDRKITEALDMIHMVLCDLELIPTKVANSAYFIIFVDGGHDNGIKKCFLLQKCISLLTKEIRRSSGIDDEVVQDQRQWDDNDLQDER